MSDTPRTDARVAIGYAAPVIDLCRTLERELAKAKDALRLICDHNDFESGWWCAEEARRALESIEGDKDSAT